MNRIILAAFCAISLAGCQSAYTYEPIIPNPPNVEMTEAQCQMLSASTQQGYIAYGSQSYVTGAAIGNALGNAIAADQFVKQCMTMKGWRRVGTVQQQQQRKPQQKAASQLGDGLTPMERKQAFDYLIAGYEADICKIKLSPEKSRTMASLRGKVGPDLKTAARSAATSSVNDSAKKIGMTEACKRSRVVIKDLGWLPA